MFNEIDLKKIQGAEFCPLGEDFEDTDPQGHVLSFNNYYMTMDGKPFFGVSGELHYSRMDPCRWEREIIKMRMGGINIVSTYVFWNHIEEEEGVFDFSGQRDLRRFVLLCRKHGLYVILRIGPFNHGEARNGGLPDWLYGKPYEVRTTDEGFLAAVKKLYDRIGREVGGLFFREGGPIIGAQLDNEYMHAGAGWEMTTGISNEWLFGGDEGEAYMLALRDLALGSGITPAFFTATAWGGAAYSPRILPLWGGYAYRPWLFYNRSGEHPPTEEYVYEDYHRDGAVCADDFLPAYAPSARPYACCEMGGGMMCCYYYRFVYPWKSVDALANVKVGSGCNFLGYYMFHGGTNPLGKHGAYLNEAQVPKRSYDYQAALGEFGQVRVSYSRAKTLHFFTRFFADRLAPMRTVLPEGASRIAPADTAPLRFAVRTDGHGGFLFVNNFQDHLVMPDRRGERVRLALEGETVDFAFGIASEENAILPFNLDLDGVLLKKATAQPVLRTEAGGRALYVFMVPEGMDGALSFEEGTRVTHVSETDGAVLYAVARGERGFDLLLVTRRMADRMFLLKNGGLVFSEGALMEDEMGRLSVESLTPEAELRAYPADLLEGTGAVRGADAGPLGTYVLETGAAKLTLSVAAPRVLRRVITVDPDEFTGLSDVRLRVDYDGDIGLLFLNNVMISDNFCNGAVWEIGLTEHIPELKKHPLILTVKPIREGAKVNVESAMAARREDVKGLRAEIRSVTLQPVYRLVL